MSLRRAALAHMAWGWLACAPVIACAQGDIDLLPGPTPMPHMMPAPCPPAGPASSMACDDAGGCPMMQRCDPASNRCVRPDCVDPQPAPVDAQPPASDAQPALEASPVMPMPEEGGR